MIQIDMLLLLASWVVIMGLFIVVPWAVVTVVGRALTISEEQTVQQRLLQTTSPAEDTLQELAESDHLETKTTNNQKRPRI